MEFSFFVGKFDNHPQMASMPSWNAFVDKMREISDIPNYKPRPKEYVNGAPLISPAIYDPASATVFDDNGNMTRNNDNVIGWDVMMADIDDNVQSLEALEKHFNGFTYLLYSSPSCTKDNLRLRVVMPLTHRCPANKLSQLWFAFNTWCNGIVDKQTKDKSRMMYIPARYTNKGDEYNHFFISKIGLELNWEKMIEVFPSPPEEDRYKIVNPHKDLERQLWEHTKSIPCMNINDPNCQFVNKRMIDEYLMTPVGSHHHAIYKFMVKICYKSIEMKYPLMIDELVDMARQMDQMDGGFYDDKKLYDSAKDALEYTNLA